MSSAAVKAGATKSEKFMHLEVSEEWGRGGGAEGGRMGSREEGKGAYYTQTSEACVISFRRKYRRGLKIGKVA